MLLFAGVSFTARPRIDQDVGAPGAGLSEPGNVMTKCHIRVLVLINGKLRKGAAPPFDDKTQERQNILTQARNLKMARSAHAYVRGSTVKF